MNDHQKEQRERTIKAISDAVEYLKSKGIKLTYRAIAEEADILKATIMKEPIKIFLLKNYGIGIKDLDGASENEKLKSEIQKLHESLSAARSATKKAKEECKSLRKDRDIWEQKYKSLLYKYAVNIDKKITSIK